MNFHYLKDGKAICGRKIEDRYLTDDWSVVDCQRCYAKKNYYPPEKYHKKSKYE